MINLYNGENKKAKVWTNKKHSPSSNSLNDLEQILF